MNINTKIITNIRDQNIVICTKRRERHKNEISNIKVFGVKISFAFIENSNIKIYSANTDGFQTKIQENPTLQNRLSENQGRITWSRASSHRRRVEVACLPVI